jgi:hypothetical protein
MRLLLVLALVGCDLGTGPLPRPPGAARFEPPAIYETLYAEMEACAGTTGDFSRVRWFVVPGGTQWASDEGRTLAGQWWPPHDIYVAERHVATDDVVAHEIGHDLSQSRDHPDPPFGACAPLSLSR